MGQILTPSGHGVTVTFTIRVRKTLGSNPSVPTQNMKKFERTIESFNCEKCGRPVEGNGYTNHCPECLTSKHVDINPGDRQAACGGLMEAVAVEKKGGELKLLHRCVNCGFERLNRVDENDNFDEVVRVSKLADQK